MNKNDRSASARAYIEEVGSILSDLPTPSINAAVMRGAGVRFSSPVEPLPGPRRLVLDGIEPGRPLATGATAAALLMRQRENLAYLGARIRHLDGDDAPGSRRPARDRAGWADHVFEVIEILKAVPLLSRADFAGAFSALASLSRLQPCSAGWEVRAADGEWVGVKLADVGLDFSVESLRSRTEANARRFRRWREALRADDQGDADDAPGGAGPASAAPTASRAGDYGPAEDAEDSDAGRKAALRHHERALRRRFPELFSGVDFAGSGRAMSVAELSARRKRFPELFAAQTPPNDGGHDASGITI